MSTICKLKIGLYLRKVSKGFSVGICIVSITSVRLGYLTKDSCVRKMDSCLFIIIIIKFNYLRQNLNSAYSHFYVHNWFNQYCLLKNSNISISGWRRLMLNMFPFFITEFLFNFYLQLIKISYHNKMVLIPYK